MDFEGYMSVYLSKRKEAFPNLNDFGICIMFYPSTMANSF